MTQNGIGKFNSTELEVIILKAVWDLIHDMVNYELFTVPTSEVNVVLRFKTDTHQRLFNILLADFFSKPKTTEFGLPDPPREALLSVKSYLFYLRRICATPKLNPIGADSIKGALEAFVQWLEEECLVTNVWFPSIELETNLRMKRIEYIKICGNISKHNFMRLNIDVGTIRKILKNNGHSIELEQAYLIIPEFYDWFHRNIFGYHSSTIAEFLNNIRWGIYRYLQPEFKKSFTKDNSDSIRYRFIYPLECKRPFVQSMYDGLMNAVRSEPYMPEFEVWEMVKKRY